jgi:predicted kinase
MKSLNLAKPLLIMIVGVPGAGKSFFAKHFSEMFSAPVVGTDRIRFELFSEPQFTADEQDIIHHLVEYQVEELLKSKATFLVDGSCNAKVERLKLAQLAKKAGYNTLVVWVQTHETTARNRATKRSSRRTDDAYNISISPDWFEAQQRRLTAPTTENYVVISGMHTYNTQAKAVLRKIIAARETAATNAHKTEIQEAVRQTRRPDSPRRSVIIR